MSCLSLMIKDQKDVILHTLMPFFCHWITIFLSKEQHFLFQLVRTNPYGRSKRAMGGRQGDEEIVTLSGYGQG